MIGHQLPNNNEMCYSTKTQTFSPIKHTLIWVPDMWTQTHLSVSQVQKPRPFQQVPLHPCRPSPLGPFISALSGFYPSMDPSLLKLSPNGYPSLFQLHQLIRSSGPKKFTDEGFDNARKMSFMFHVRILRVTSPSQPHCWVLHVNCVL